MGSGFDVSGISVGAMFLAGTAAVVVFGWVFLAGGKYRRPPRELSPAEFEWARREAEAMEARLAPKLMALAEMERYGGGTVLSGGVEGRVWETFAVASADLEKDPLSAIEGFRDVEAMLDGMLAKAREIEESEEAFGKETG